MSQYIFLSVKEIVRETADAITIIFQKPTLITNYKSGQFLTLILDINGEKLRRSYSLSSSPYADEDWAVSVKKIKGGKVSTYLVDQLKEGDIIETMAPAGIFTYEPSISNTSDIVLIGAGSGITPLLSIIKSTLKVESNSNVYLLYANRNEDSIMLDGELSKIKANNVNRFHRIDVFSQPQNKSSEFIGRLDKQRITQLLENFKTINITKALYFVCGPQGMMEESFKALEALKVQQNNIRKESFAPASNANTETKTEKAHPSTSSIGASTVEIKYGKHLHKVTVAPGKTILEAALDQNIDLPYSCQSGMCTACMGKCTSGQVKMDDPDGLSESEIKQGFVLTCVGRPLTENVSIVIE